MKKAFETSHSNLSKPCNVGTFWLASVLITFSNSLWPRWRDPRPTFSLALQRCCSSPKWEDDKSAPSQDAQHLDQYQRRYVLETFILGNSAPSPGQFQRRISTDHLKVLLLKVSISYGSCIYINKLSTYGTVWWYYSQLARTRPHPMKLFVPLK